MPYLHGTVIKVSRPELSQNNNWYTRGILEDKEKILHDFVIFWDNEIAIKEINTYDVIDLVGKKDRTEGTFKANFMRDFKVRNYLQENIDKSDKTYKGDDAIEGQAPIEFAMDVLGAQFVEKEIRKLTNNISDIFKSTKQSKQVLNHRTNKLEWMNVTVFPKVDEYKQLLADLVKIAKDIKREQRI